MPDIPTPESTSDRTRIYEIRIKGHLDPRWTDWFDGLRVDSDVNGETVLTGPVIDQAALHGLLRKVRDVGLPLLSIIHVDPADTGPTS